MKLHHALLIAVLAVVALPGLAAAQSDWEPREFVAFVTPKAKFSGLGQSEHLLIFDQPVQIPGAKLSAGAYIFNVVMPSLLRVTDDTRARVYATFFVMPLYRREEDDGRERIKFQQMGDESPRIVGWYIPGQTGYEFLYQKSKRPEVDRRLR